ncbi:MAG: BrnT family toxin [bacterium]|nr:BrnT family toxin [Candidatus Omnitrophota bacterium]MBU1524694.1 BrnT family toxin [Candidatus Omnitrophota bacterium]
MHIDSFDWDEKNEDHIAEHGVAIFEVEETILFSKPFYQRSREGKYIAYVVTKEGRYLFIVFVIKDSGRIRVISARDMSEKEKCYYKKRKGVK